MTSSIVVIDPKPTARDVRKVDDGVCCGLGRAVGALVPPGGGTISKAKDNEIQATGPVTPVRHAPRIKKPRRSGVRMPLEEIASESSGG